jgi:hypothetical protein
MLDYYSDCDSQYDDNWYDDDLQCCYASERDEVDSQFHSDSNIDSELFEYDNIIDCSIKEVSGHCLQENALGSLYDNYDHRDHDGSGYYDLNGQSYNLDNYNSDDENTFDLFSDDGCHFCCPKEHDSTFVDTATKDADHELNIDDNSSCDIELISDNWSQQKEVYDSCDALNDDQLMLMLMSWLAAADAYGASSLGYKSRKLAYMINL